MIKRALTSAVSFMLMLLLTACALSGGQGRAAEELPLVKDGTSEFHIIYPCGADESVVEAASYIQREVERLSDVSLDVCEDMARAADSESYEILIGGTDREESAQASGKMTYAGEYLICVEGKKLAVVSAMPEHLTTAVQELCDALGEYFDGDALTLPADFRLNDNLESDTLLSQLPAFRYGTPVASCDAGVDGTELIYSANSEDFDSYSKDLTSAGYDLYTQHTIDENRYATFVADTSTVTLMDNPALSTVRMTVEPKGALPETEAADFQKLVQPSVTMIGQEDHKYGMCFVYQLSDGSFIVVDGGYNDNSAPEWIYQTMKDKAPDGQITIAAWILTHSHNDHVGAFCNFSDYHAGDVTLEKLIYNFPNETQYDQASQSRGWRNHAYKAQTRYPDTDIITAHPGQVFYLRDAVVEVLYTTELLVPRELEVFNDSSVVFTLALGGQKTMMLGDCSSVSGALLMQLYTEALKCDILQVAHHGYYNNSVSANLYMAIAPKYVLWPSGTENYTSKNTQNNASNVWLWNNIDSDRLWVAAEGIVSLPLPIEN